MNFAYGELARQAGLDAAVTILMSILVFAGSAQFIAISRMSDGASLTTITATTFVVNLRHALMATAQAPYLRSWSWPRLAAFAAQLTSQKSCSIEEIPYSWSSPATWKPSKPFACSRSNLPLPLSRPQPPEPASWKA